MAKFVSFLNPSLVDQEGLQKYLTRLFGPGVATAFNANGWKVTQRGAGANMSVDIAVGDGLLLRPSGDYGFWGWTTATENVAVTASNPTNPRIDVVVAWIDTSVTTTGSANSPNALKFQVMAGTPAGSPTAMADATIQSTLGAAVAWIKLATFTVAAGSSSVVNANISDVRTGITGLVNSAVADGSITTAKIADASVTNAKLSTTTGEPGGGWTLYTPVISTGSGAYSNATLAGRYMRIGKSVLFKIDINIIAVGTATDVRATLPPVSARYVAGEQTAVASGREYAVNGKALAAFLLSTSTVGISYYDNTNPNANGVKLSISGLYEAA